MPNSIILHSFTSGELSPGLYARTDITKYQSGCALAKNFYVDPAGGLSNRPGTAFVGRVKQGSNQGGSTNPPTSQKGTITGWVNPVGIRVETTDTLCAGNQIVFQNDPSADFVGELLIYFGNQGADGGHGSGNPEIILPGKLNITFAFFELSAANGTLVNLFQISSGDFWNATATYPNIPVNGFPVMLTWDFTGNNWTAGIWQGHDDGTWTNVDAYCYTQVNNGSINFAATKPLAVGSPLDTGFSFFAGGGKDFWFDFGSDEGLERGPPPPANPYHTDMWDPCEWSQWWFGFGQVVDASTASSLYYDNTSTPKWAPIDLGSNGALPTGTEPTLYFSRGLEPAYISDGVLPVVMPIYEVTTQDFVTPTAPADASTIPASGAYQALGVRFGINNGAAISLPVSAPGIAACPLPPAPALIPFTFSTIQTYMLEFGEDYMRVVKDGGYVLNGPFTITGVTKATPGVVTTSATHSYTAGTWVFIAGVGGMTQLNGRSFIVASPTTFTFALHDLDGNPLDTLVYDAYTSGGTVRSYFELVTPYDQGDTATLKYTQSADVLTITHPSYPPADITRTADNAWTYTPITFQPGINPPTTASATASMSGSYTYRYEITAISGNTGEESRPSKPVLVTSAQMSQTTGANIRLTWTPVAGASGYNVYRQPEVTTIPDQGMLYGFAGSTTGINFTDQNILPDFTRTPPQARNPFAKSAIQYVIVVSSNTSFTSGTTVTVTDSTGVGWQGFIEIDSGTGHLAAVITQYGGQDYTAPVFTFSGGATAVLTIVLGPSTGTYPSCCSYFQQRKVFAGSLNQPETIWMSQIGNFNNMDISSPTRDSDAITVTLASLQVNIVKWLVPQTSGLMVGTASGAWQVSGGQLGDAVTPSNIVAQPQAFNGSADVPPLPINTDIIFLENNANVVRDLTYTFYQNIWQGTDTTVLSRQLFFGHEITHWAYQDTPFKLIWAIREDGVMLTQTFLKEQEVFGWTHGDTQGFWRAIGTIREGDENAVYVIAERRIPGINNNNPIYYMERVASRDFYTPWNAFEADVTAAWFLDCAAQYPVVTPAACLDLNGNQLIASTDSFSANSVGSIIRVNGGILTLQTYSSSTLSFSSTIVQPDSDRHATTGAWTLTQPVQTVTGLWHLEGAQVFALSNGSVEGPFTVQNGEITLSVASDIVTVGLLYDAQFQSLYIDTGLPTTQGKRKTIPGVTLRVWSSRGAQVGPDFDTLAPMKERQNEQMGQPTALTTGDERINIQSQWRTVGQVCIELNYPLPFTLTGLIPEVLIGDQG